MLDEVLFMRSGTSNPFGKCDEEVRSLVDSDTKEALTALAFASGMSMSEYLRHLIISHVYGHGTILRLAQRPGFTTTGKREE